MSSLLRHPFPAAATVAMISAALTAGCGSDAPRPSPLPSPTPSPAPTTASAYILPDAASKGDMAFGDKPIVIYRGERLRWVNADTIAHVIAADSPDATDFRKSDELRAGGEHSIVMNKLGTTRIHCDLHPNMTGTLTVRER